MRESPFCRIIRTVFVPVVVLVGKVQSKMSVAHMGRHRLALSHLINPSYMDTMGLAAADPYWVLPTPEKPRIGYTCQ